MYKPLFFVSFLFLLIGCTNSSPTGILVKTNEELANAISGAQAGDEIVMANGTWKDLQIQFTGEGTERQPILLRAETPGEVFVEGESDLKFGGDYLTVSGLHFRNGYTPGKTVISFRLSEDSLANHCRVTQCVIDGFTQPHRDRADHWVEFWGRHNQFDHCYLAGKSNQGPTIRVYIRGNQSIRNYHQITDNHFGPRPRKGGPRAETIQLGDSGTSMSPSNTMVANNFFEKCNGEVEVISSKTNFNEFRNNVFFQCEGSLVMRHGNYCVIDANYFIGEEDSDNIGGIRIINTGHWVTNNYFVNLRGKSFRSPLAVMNGIPKSPLNRYNQVTDVVVAHNTWVNCEAPWQFGVGTNISQRDVLPPSEIRSARPIRTTVANNLIYNESGDQSPVVAHDKTDGVLFKNNLINNQGRLFEPVEGLEPASFEMTKAGKHIFVPGVLDAEVYAGFDFETIDTDLFGNSRNSSNQAGAVCGNEAKDPKILDKSKYGPDWWNSEKPERASEEITVTPTLGSLAQKISETAPGDVIVLAPGTYRLDLSLVIDKKISLRSMEVADKARLEYSGSAGSPAFALHPGADLTLSQLVLSGTKTQYAFASLRENMSTHYQLNVSETEISDFAYVLKAYKESFADAISFSNCVLKNCQNGIELSEERKDKGDYNVEFLTIDHCQFDNIPQNVIDYYRGGYDESTIGGNFLVTNSIFTNCGGREENGILLNTRGIINVNISKNIFRNNPVKLVALLWGAKNNNHSENEIQNSGKIVVEENLKLKLIY